jgi:hypothetical protein
MCFPSDQGSKLLAEGLQGPWAMAASDLSPPSPPGAGELEQVGSEHLLRV